MLLGKGSGIRARVFCAIGAHRIVICKPGIKANIMELMVARRHAGNLVIITISTSCFDIGGPFKRFRGRYSATGEKFPRSPNRTR